MITQDEINHAAKRLRELGVPDDYNRWLRLTPAKFDAHEAAKATIAAQQRGEMPMAKIGTKEQALRAQRAETKKPETVTVSGVKPASMNGTAMPTATTPAEPAAEAAKPQESIMKTTTAKKKTPAKPARKATSKRTARKATKVPAKKGAHSAARTAVKGQTEAKAIRPGTKLATIMGLLQRKEGCTTADVLKATKWPSVSMPQQAKAAGLELITEKEGRITTYWAKGHEPDRLKKAAKAE